MYFNLDALSMEVSNKESSLIAFYSLFRYRERDTCCPNKNIPNIKSVKLSRNVHFVYFRKGLIYFPDFCDIVLDGYRPSKEEEEDFYQTVFKECVS